MASADLQIPAQQAPTAAQVALRTPEILLNIFSNASTLDPISLALVCRAFTAPAYSLLYRKLSLEWRVDTVELLLRSFNSNPNLSTLVHSVEIWDQITNERWKESEAVDSLVDFLRRLKNLHHLSLNCIHWSGGEPPSIPISLQTDFHTVMRGLVRLDLDRVASSFWEGVCGGTTSLDRLSLTNSFYPTFQTLPPLRHLEIFHAIYNDMEISHESETLALGFTKTLDTL